MLQVQDAIRLSLGSAASSILVAAWSILLLLTTAEALGEDSAGDLYLGQVKPLLRARCYPCHGGLRQEGELRVDTGAALLRGGVSGPGLVAGDPDASLLMARLTAADAAERMPPEGEPLTDEERHLLAQWIRAGANFPSQEQPERMAAEHWSFQPIRRPALPATATLSSAAAAPPQPLDRFIDQEWNARQLSPQPAATPEELLRRVYLDLLGIPPTPQQQREFLADPSPTAYARVIDQLLASPLYGERWARHWMDIWRYSDWYGRRHVPDVWNSAPQIWRWRDWIVRSLNEDRGYDQMLAEMLAADELAPGDNEAAVATGYLIRNWYALNPNDWMRNTVEHTGKAFLGLTFHCAHCHDHKYDPISQEDYFRFRAFFEPIGIRQDRVPGAEDPGPFQEYDYSVLRKVQRAGMVAIFDQRPDAPTWFYRNGDERNRHTDRGSLPPGLPTFLLDRPLHIQPVALPVRAWYPAIQAANLTAERQAAADAVRSLEQQLASSPSSEPSTAANAADAAAPTASAASHADPTSLRWELQIARASLASLEARQAAEQLRYESAGKSEQDLALCQHAVMQAIVAERELALLRAERDAWSARRSWEQATLTAAAQSAADGSAATADAALTMLRHALEEAEAAVARTAAARDAPLDLASGDPSPPYPPLGRQYPATSTGRRSALARWITHPDNPLTARVAVNHLWNWHFHAPLVSTVTDFGRNGAPPSHPQLLDWLAAEFQASGWSQKHLHRMILMSAAYQRSSRVPIDTPNHAHDPENRWLWRMNTGRMEAEVVRDSILALAGQLDLTCGGQELENEQALTTFRRSIYYSVYPEQGGKSPLGELFDAPDPLDCYRRSRSIVPQQALALTNSDLVHAVAPQIAAVIHAQTANLGEDAFLEASFRHVLARAPTVAERQSCRQFLTRFPVNDADQHQQQAALVRVLLNHHDFLTVR